MELTVQPKNISVTMSEVQVCLSMYMISIVVEIFHLETVSTKVSNTHKTSSPLIDLIRQLPITLGQDSVYWFYNNSNWNMVLRVRSQSFVQKQTGIKQLS